jgi:hypothetical protein
MKHKERKTVSNCSLSRRSFLKNSALATAALTVNPSAIFADEKKSTDPKSIVVISENKKAITESYKIDSRRVREMIDEGIKALTNTKSSKEGWLEIFPNLKAKEVIGLKVNSVNPKIPAHPQVAYAIVDSMVDAGIKQSNILIWDNLERFLTGSGYKINTSDKEGYRCYGTYHDMSLPFKSIARSVGHGPYPDLNMWLDPDATVHIKSENLVRSYSRILSQHIDYLINVPAFKASYYAGVTIALKNMYGTISLSEQAVLGIYPSDMGEVVVKMHAHNANPQIAEVNAGEALMKKTKLVVVDALMGIYEGDAHADPQGLDHKIIISQDRVATDFTGFEIINARRKERGIAPITKEKAGIIWSAEKLGIGNADPKKIEVRKIHLTT